MLKVLLNGKLKRTINPFKASILAVILSKLLILSSQKQLYVKQVKSGMNSDIVWKEFIYYRKWWTSNGDRLV